MGYVYNDAEMLMASQIAYLDFDGCKGMPVGEVVDKTIERYAKRDANGNPMYGADGEIMLRDDFANSPDKDLYKHRVEVAADIKKIGEEKSGLEGWENWKVADVCDDNDETGYYGMLIDTGDGNAIIANRGSESYDSAQLKKDWAESDFGLLNSECTKQQGRAEKYMDELWYKYGDKYDTFSVTGHSLGGNLSEHMTITAPAAMRGKIDHTVSFDGPGFSDEYLEAHRDEIARIRDGQMSHYQWSLVGSLLTHLPCSKDTVIDAHNEPVEYGESKIDNLIKYLGSMFRRHSLGNVLFDENGNVMPGEKCGVSYLLEPLSKTLDDFSSLDWALAITALIGAAKLCFPVITELIAGVALIAVAANKMREAGQAIYEKLQDFYYEHIAADVSGDFEVNPERIMEYAYVLDGKISALRDERDELDGIRKDLKYWSTAGAYYRSRLVNLRIGLGSDISHLEKIRRFLSETVAEGYNAADARAASHFG